jgi:glucokinase
MLIAGDIGGTKTDLAVYSPETGAHEPLAAKQFRSASYPSLTTMVQEFLRDVTVPVDRACFDVAGPVINGAVKTTNLPWFMDEATLASELGFRSVHLMNDLEAVARAVPVLRSTDYVTLNEGVAIARGTIGIIAPGTGLGESFLTWNGVGYEAHSSEGGHSDFAPTDTRQLGLLTYMLKQHHHVGVERVCSGIGIPNLYEYLRDVEDIADNPDVADRIAAAPDRTHAIVDAGLDEQNPSTLSRETVELFVSILGSEAGNLALKVLATGGIYMAGSLALRIVGEGQKSTFRAAFTNKGRFAQLMQTIPIHVIFVKAALLGAATYGLQRMYGVGELDDEPSEATVG